MRIVSATALFLIAGTAIAHHHDKPVHLAHHDEAPMQTAHDHRAHGHAAMAEGPAASATIGPIAVEGAYARAAAVPGGASAAYMILSIADGADTLRTAASPAAARVELHTHTLDDKGVARMMQVPGIEVTSGSPSVLKPGGLHVMLMGLTAPLAPGDSIEMTLTFERAGAVTFSIPVRGIGRPTVTN